jgi:hypothetical protein
MKKDLPEKEFKSPTLTLAGQTLRDRLDQLNSTRQGNGKAGTRNNNAPAGMPKSFQKNTFRNMSQKTRKGLRPG